MCRQAHAAHPLRGWLHSFQVGAIVAVFAIAIIAVGFVIWRKRTMRD
jgi:hypothetical protein